MYVYQHVTDLTQEIYGFYPKPLLQAWPVADWLLYILRSTLLQQLFEYLSAATADQAVFSMSRASSRVCCLLLHRSRVQLLINLITSNSALVLKTAFPTSCKCARIISLFFCCYKQKPASSVKLHKNNTTLNFDVSPA